MTTIAKKRTTSRQLGFALWLFAASGLQSCAAEGGFWDCVETKGYCLQSQVCDSITRKCERKCTEHPPRLCPEGTTCDYATGSCRVWCKSDGRTTETVCYDGADDDCDGLADCADDDCDGLGCGNGCVCGTGTRRETICNDGIDNNQDGLIDCADPNCVGVVCRPKAGPCDVEELCAGGNSACPANVFVADNTSCGTGCACMTGTATETNCADLVDNDGDARIDCADSTNCPLGTVCQQPNTSPGTCKGDLTCG